MLKSDVFYADLPIDKVRRLTLVSDSYAEKFLSPVYSKFAVG